MWVAFVSQSASQIGFENENPDYLFGCYKYGASQIELSPGAATFNGQRIEISYGLRKQLREVFYPQSFPWYDRDTNSFVFKNDRFELVNLVQDEDGTWSIKIWESDYLSSQDPADLNFVYFKSAPCSGS